MQPPYQRGRPRPAPEDATVRSASPVVIRPARSYTKGQKAAGCFATFAVFALLLIGFFFWQMNVWNRADKLSTDLRAERISNLDDAWSKYQDLASSTHMPWCFRGRKVL